MAKAKVKINEEAEILKSQLARTLADYDNLKKRTDEEKISFLKYSSRQIIEKLLPILDNLENANNHLKDAGLAITIGEFKRILNEEGLIEIRPIVGDEFNEQTMEAIEIVEGEVENTVSEIVLTGWQFDENNIVRHAKVKVYKANEGKKTS